MALGTGVKFPNYKELSIITKMLSLAPENKLQPNGSREVAGKT